MLRWTRDPVHWGPSRWGQLVRNLQTGRLFPHDVHARHLVRGCESSNPPEADPNTHDPALN